MPAAAAAAAVHGYISDDRQPDAVVIGRRGRIAAIVAVLYMTSSSHHDSTLNTAARADHLQLSRCPLVSSLATHTDADTPPTLHVQSRTAAIRPSAGESIFCYFQYIAQRGAPRFMKLLPLAAP